MPASHDPSAHTGRTPAVAARIRRKHERGIHAEGSPRRQLWRAWSWVLAELLRRPDHTEHAIKTVTGLARDLNERSIR